LEELPPQRRRRSQLQQLLRRRREVPPALLDLGQLRAVDDEFDQLAVDVCEGELALFLAPRLVQCCNEDLLCPIPNCMKLLLIDRV
jgi:hypothetical protein